MRIVVQYRCPGWQANLYKDFAKKNKISTSSLSRFALNYVLLRYKGKISAQLMDEIEFVFRKRFGPKPIN